MTASMCTGMFGTSRPGRLALQCLLLAALALSLGCGAKRIAPPEVVYPAYQVGAPDRLAVTILPEPRFEQELVVRPDGKITVELVGDVQAGGRTTQEIGEEIQSRISRYKRGAVVTVSLLAAESSAVTVLGEVRTPRSFPLTKQMRVAEALGLVGGVTNFANDDSIQVVRGGDPTKVIDVDMDAIRAGDLTTNVQLYGGDIVYVPPTMFARIGYAIQMLLFPFQPFLGLGTAAAAGAI